MRSFPGQDALVPRRVALVSEVFFARAGCPRSQGGWGSLPGEEFLGGDYGNKAAVFAAFSPVPDGAVGNRKQRVVASEAYVGAGMKGGSTLAHENIAGQHFLAAVFLDPSRLDSESRPLRELPAAFLCAIRQLSLPACLAGDFSADAPAGSMPAISTVVNCWRCPSVRR